MEIGMREVLIVMGCIIMAVLFFDAYRRVRDHRRSQFGYRLNERTAPSTPATLAGFDDDELAEDEPLTAVRPAGQSGGRIGYGNLGRKNGRHNLETDKRAKDVATSEPFARSASTSHSNSKSAASKTTSSKPAGSPKQIRVRISTPKNAAPAKAGQRQKSKENRFPELSISRSDTPMKALLQPALATAPEAGDFYSNRRNSVASRNARKIQDQNQEQQPAEPAQQQPEEVIIMHVVAQDDEVFDGEVLVHHALAQNLRHGEMKIFHRYERPDQHQGHLFSMANMVKPGTFELDHMNAFETPGVTFFLTLPCGGGALYAFDLMVDTARKLSKVLDGELHDETHSVITAQTVEHYRQKVMEFERKQRMMEKTRLIRERSKVLE